MLYFLYSHHLNVCAGSNNVKRNLIFVTVRDFKRVNQKARNLVTDI